MLTGQEWKLAKDKDGIYVYTRKVEGQSIKDVRIKTTLNTSLTELVAALEDFSGTQSWVKNTVASRKIEELSPTHFYFYSATDFPFPAKDRDVVIKCQRSQDKNTNEVRIDYEAAHDKMGKQDGFVRMAALTASYVLNPTSAKKVEVEYYLRVDIAGTIPKWVINMAISKGPTDTMKALREVLASGRYADTVVPDLVDPYK